MAKNPFHITDTREVEECFPRKRGCRFANIPNSHFDTREAAYAAGGIDTRPGTPANKSGKPRWHINSLNELDDCGAVKVRCQFEQTSHFWVESEGQAEVLRRGGTIKGSPTAGVYKPFHVKNSGEGDACGSSYNPPRPADRKCRYPLEDHFDTLEEANKVGSARRKARGLEDLNAKAASGKGVDRLLPSFEKLLRGRSDKLLALYEMGESPACTNFEDIIAAHIDSIVRVIKKGAREGHLQGDTLKALQKTTGTFKDRTAVLNPTEELLQKTANASQSLVRRLGQAVEAGKKSGTGETVARSSADALSTSGALAGKMISLREELAGLAGVPALPKREGYSSQEAVQVFSSFLFQTGVSRVSSNPAGFAYDTETYGSDAGAAFSMEVERFVDTAIDELKNESPAVIDDLLSDAEYLTGVLRKSLSESGKASTESGVSDEVAEQLWKIKYGLGEPWTGEPRELPKGSSVQKHAEGFLNYFNDIADGAGKSGTLTDSSREDLMELINPFYLRFREASDSDLNDMVQAAQGVASEAEKILLRYKGSGQDAKPAISERVLRGFHRALTDFGSNWGVQISPLAADSDLSSVVGDVHQFIFDVVEKAVESNFLDDGSKLESLAEDFYQSYRKLDNSKAEEALHEAQTLTRDIGRVLSRRVDERDPDGTGHVDGKPSKSESQHSQPAADPNDTRAYEMGKEPVPLEDVKRMVVEIGTESGRKNVVAGFVITLKNVGREGELLSKLGPVKLLNLNTIEPDPCELVFSLAGNAYRIPCSSKDGKLVWGRLQLV